MTQNDFLHPLLILSPFIVYLIILSCGFGSLVLVAIRTKSIRNALIKNPAFMVGDVFLLPAAGGLITFFYQQIVHPIPVTTNPTWTTVTLIVSLFITLFFGVKFKFLNKRIMWWLPHGILHWFFMYLFLTFVTKGLFQLLYGQGSIVLWVLWWLVILMVAIHQFLGQLWPKRIPFEEDIL